MIRYYCYPACLFSSHHSWCWSIIANCPKTWLFSSHNTALILSSTSLPYLQSAKQLVPCSSISSVSLASIALEFTGRLLVRIVSSIFIVYLAILSQLVFTCQSADPILPDQELLASQILSKHGLHIGFSSPVFLL